MEGVANLAGGLYFHVSLTAGACFSGFFGNSRGILLERMDSRFKPTFFGTNSMVRKFIDFLLDDGFDLNSDRRGE